MSPSDKKLIQATAYSDWLASVKSRIHAARMKSALAANSERESAAQWGSRFIDAFSKHLKASFPEVGGFSAKNLRDCRAFFRFYCKPAIWQQAVAKWASDPWAGLEPGLVQRIAPIPWGHHIQIFSQCAGIAEADIYIGQPLEQGWSRDVLVLQLKARVYDRTGKAVTNVPRTLTAPQSDPGPADAESSRHLRLHDHDDLLDTAED